MTRITVEYTTYRYKGSLQGRTTGKDHRDLNTMFGSVESKLCIKHGLLLVTLTQHFTTKSSINDAIPSLVDFTRPLIGTKRIPSISIKRNIKFYKAML